MDLGEEKLKFLESISKRLEKPQGQEVPQALEDWELEAIVMALAIGGGEFTEETTQRILDWAVEARVSAWLVNMTIDGYVKVVVEPNGSITFALTDKGKDAIEKHRKTEEQNDTDD